MGVNLAKMWKYLLYVFFMTVFFISPSVYADSAWVIWQHIVSNNPVAPIGGDWQPVYASKDQGQCEVKSKQFSKNSGATEGAGGYTYVTEYICLPDTIDPRWQKNK